MDTNRLYDIADKENIMIIDFKMKNKAIIGQVGTRYCIGINYSVLDNCMEEKEILSEELGHYYTNTLYTSTLPLETISRCENRAKKWAYNILIPYNKLKSVIENGISDIYSLSDYFDVTVTYIQNVIQFYIDKYGYITKEKVFEI